MIKLKNRKSLEKNNETKSLLFEEINKIDNSLVRLIKKKKEMSQITHIIQEKK